MSHPIHRVMSFESVAPYTLHVHFEDGTEQVIDFEPVLQGEIFAPLRDLELFRQVRIDPEADTLVWPNGADFDPATLYYWPRAGRRLVALARKWGEPAAGRTSAA
jgi:Protein of unknown function (DUF2442)